MVKYHPRFEVDHRGVALGMDVAGEGRDLTVLTACESSKLFFPKLVDKHGAPLPCWHRGRDHLAAVDSNLVAACPLGSTDLEIVEFQSTGEGRSFSRSEADQLLDLGLVGCAQLMAAQRETLAR